MMEVLCISDGSVDAERSIVTDLVSQVDPEGIVITYLYIVMRICMYHTTHASVNTISRNKGLIFS